MSETKTNKDVEVKLQNVRLSFAHLFTAQKPKTGDGKPKFNCSFLMDKNTEQGKKNIAAVKAAILAARIAKWGKDFPKLKANLFCLRDGDEETYEGYAGMMYVSANNVKRPTVIDRDRTPLTEEDGKPYSGCFVNAIIRIWCLDDKEYGKRVCASLEGVQFLKDGEAFGSAPLSSEAFDDLGEDEDEGSDSDEDGDGLY